MKSSVYFCGDNFDGMLLQELTYPQALQRKILWAEELVNELLEEDMFHRDGVRIFKAMKAIKQWQKQYNECFGLDKEME